MVSHIEVLLGSSRSVRAVDLVPGCETMISPVRVILEKSVEDVGNR